mmetsp:Transcript_154756/g.496105  ORF Transcript_154756/g.496105 Transcript_154756/m.496105 type:complete len:340 (-) Transcript_154756:128-1147(-)
MPLVGGILSGLLLVSVPATLQTEVMLPLSGVVSLLGGQFVCNHAVFAALADATQGATSEERSQIFSVVEGMLWAGLLVGPYVGGVLAATIGDTNAILLSVAVGVCNLLITTGAFKETLSVGRRSPLRWRRANPVTSISLFLETRTTILLAIITLAGSTAMTTGTAVVPFYAERWAGAGPEEVGLLISASLGASCVGLIVIMPWLVRCLSMTRIMVLSNLNTVVCWLVMSICIAQWEIIAILACQLCSGLFFPIVRTGMGNVFGQRRYGEALAAVGTLEQISALLTPIGLSLYRATEDVSLDMAGGRFIVHGVAFMYISGVALLGLCAAALVPGIPCAAD